MTTAPPPRPPIGQALPHPYATPPPLTRPAPQPSAWARRWPGPTAPARSRVLAATAVAAGTSASVVPLDRPGLGWLVAAVAGAAALGATVLTRPRPAARPGATGASGRVARLVWTLATVALVAVGTVRAAGWLFALCLVAAFGTAALAVAGGRTPLGLLSAGLLPPVAAVRALPWAARGLPRPRPGGPGVGRVLASLGVTVLLLLLFGLLFASADAVFADLVTGALPDVSPAGGTGWLGRALLAGAVLLGGAYLLAAPPDLELRAGPARAVRRLEWVLPLALLDLLFAAFVLVQLTVLFGGSGHVLRTAGLTYAEYARGGFWQLLAVSLLTLLVIAGAVRWAPRDGRTDRILIRVLIGGLALLSLVVVASALYRMRVYTDAYGATRLRLLVAVAELWLGLLFVLVGAATVRLRGSWLPRVALGAAVLALLGLALVDPDRLIAERNVERWQRTGRLDVTYLSGLSPDAVPALDRLPEPLRSCALWRIDAELPADGWRAANLGRAQARAVLAGDPATWPGTFACP
ncbi:DUF4153 domain-containing protein [Micromonospora auratinigra]|uniref:Uncharacterized protein n=1 Tax=Micromonospora auratinigra TaxID=261654 RepID=A0A1A9A050_9ACTN|nr:DUF4173 domain-containing protein [Micromonospora auratinigra]SBT49468.1 protein of unknown function (DUF4173) [Micromonospora auratinigra]